MLVKAKWSVADASGWHKTGEVFDTKEDLGGAVEVLLPENKPAQQPPEEEPGQETAEQPARETQKRGGRAKTAK